MAAAIQILLILTLSHLAAGQTRLMIQTTVNTQQGVGRVEVLLGGQWIPVCSTNWATNANNAIVACRSAGFPGGGITFQNVAIYGQSNSFFRLDSVRCTGTEASLLDCSYAACFNCSDREVVGVNCITQTPAPTTTTPVMNTCGTGTPARLMIYNTISTVQAVGRVEVCNSGIWMAVCETNWLNNPNNANVACRSVGFARGGVTLINEAIYGTSSIVFHLDSMNCAGTEASILNCAYVLCLNCTRQVGVTCINTDGQNGNSTGTSVTATPSPPVSLGVCGNLPVVSQSPDGSLSLVGREPGIGYVCIRAPNITWGSVCDDYWDLMAARVACRQLGLENRNFAEPNLPLLYKLAIPTPTRFVLDDVRCRGYEGSIQSCPHNAWFDHDCTSTEVAALSCIGPPPDTTIRRVPALECNDGHFLVQFTKAQYPNVRASDLSIADPFVGACTFNPQEDTQRVWVRVDFDECGTRVSQNATHIIYTVKIRVANTVVNPNSIITREQEVMVVEVCCEIPRNYTVTRPYIVVTANPKICEDGLFNVSMWIYRNLSTNVESRVQVYPYSITLGDSLEFGVELATEDERLKLVVNHCRAWRGLTAGTPPSYPLFTNKCQSDLDLQLIPVSRLKFAFRIPSFKFRDGPDTVILECDAIVCLTTELTSECDQTCNNMKPAPNYLPGRRRRQAENETANSTVHTVVKVFSGPIYIIKSDVDTTTATTPVLSTTTLPPGAADTKKPSTISMTTSATLPPVTEAMKKPSTTSMTDSPTLPAVIDATKKPSTTSTTTETTDTTTTSTSTIKTSSTTTVSTALNTTYPGATGWVSVTIIPPSVLTSSPSPGQAPKAAEVDARVASSLNSRPGQALADDVQISVEGAGADLFRADGADSASGAGYHVPGYVSLCLALLAAVWKTLCA